MKSYLISCLIISSALIMSACAPKVVETEPLRPVTQNSQGQAAANALQYGYDKFGSPAPAQGDVPVNGLPAAGSAQAPNSTNKSPATTGSTPIEEQGEPMRTLKDFQPVTANEVTITTTKGDIVIELYPDKSPLTVTNFLTLAKSNYYNGVKFHRIISGFMAQVGDPLTKDDSQKAMWGTGGPGYTIQDEFAPDLTFTGPGIVAMANTGQPNTGGSQFFITYADTPWLNGKHAIFGKVTQGMDVVNAMVIGDQITGVSYK